MEISFTYTIPRLIAGKTKISKPYQNYNAKGTPVSWGMDMEFPELNLSKTLKSRDFHLMRGKIENTLHSWETKYQRYLDKKHKESRASSVEEKNVEAKENIDALNGILRHTLDIDDTVDWDTIKRKDNFKIDPIGLFDGNEEFTYINFSPDGRPLNFEEISEPYEPKFEEFKKQYGIFSKLFRTGKIKEDYKNELNEWESDKVITAKKNNDRKVSFNNALLIYEKKKQDFEEEKQRNNNAVDEFKLRYNESDSKAIEEYCDLVLNNSEYPDYFQKNWVLEYRQANKMVIVDYELPSPKQLPNIKSLSYVKSRDEITKKLLTDAQLRKLYDSVIYQICIRTIHELCEADTTNAIEAVAFNGLVTNINPATGIKETNTIISVLADKDKFLKFDLKRVNPKATFKHLKGVSTVNLANLTPIPPVIQLEKTDKRFIDGRAVADQLDVSTNLAAMNWDDFEHLIRELFEKEFASGGGEVKVTQASSDGGVDAIAFDPDPIRGGKIVIQAKRYTNTVGVAAVRDLYGTVLNEGATKGILVTTSDYGKDSYEFAKDKPITLLTGGNLLALLQKHGHKAHINIAEAKKILKAMG